MKEERKKTYLNYSLNFIIIVLIILCGGFIWSMVKGNKPDKEPKPENIRDTIVTKSPEIKIDAKTISAEVLNGSGENKIGKVCRFLIGEEKNRGKGFGHMILQEILRIGFEDRNYETIMLGVFDFNQGAIHCYEHVGFARETFLKNARKSSTGCWNLYEMGISKQKWLGMKV